MRFIDNFSFSIADIPGIIKDAHQNKGLGLEFLRHIQRTKVLVYVLDISSDSPLMTQYTTLKEELRHYDPTLLDKESFAIVNKADTHPEADGAFRDFQQNSDLQSFLISAKMGFGLEDVVVAGREKVQDYLRGELEKEEIEKEKEKKKR